METIGALDANVIICADICRLLKRLFEITAHTVKVIHQQRAISYPVSLSSGPSVLALVEIDE